MDCIWVNLKNVGPPFFKFISVYIKMSFKQLENHSQLLCGRDSENSDLQIGVRGRLRARFLRRLTIVLGLGSSRANHACQSRGF